MALLPCERPIPVPQHEIVMRRALWRQILWQGLPLILRWSQLAGPVVGTSSDGEALFDKIEIDCGRLVRRPIRISVRRAGTPRVHKVNVLFKLNTIQDRDTATAETKRGSGENRSLTSGRPNGRLAVVTWTISLVRLPITEEAADMGGRARIMALVQISLAGETESRRQHWIRQRAPRSKSQARFCPSLEAFLTRTGLS